MIPACRSGRPGGGGQLEHAHGFDQAIGGLRQVGGGLGLAGYDYIVPAAREELMRRTIPESRSLLAIVPSQVESPGIGAACHLTSCSC